MVLVWWRDDGAANDLRRSVWSHGGVVRLEDEARRVVLRVKQITGRAAVRQAGFLTGSLHRRRRRQRDGTAHEYLRHTPHSLCYATGRTHSAQLASLVSARDTD